MKVRAVPCGRILFGDSGPDFEKIVGYAQSGRVYLDLGGSLFLWISGRFHDGSR
jgi:hypothetical protein